MSTDLNNALLVEFECPVCTHYMHPPIVQCTNGHSFCNDCFGQLKNCPSCRQALRYTCRSFVLERLHGKLVFPCKYALQGCTHRSNGEIIEEHEAHCRLGAYACPLKILNNCAWYGRGRQSTAEHCREVHATNFFTNSAQLLTCSNFTREATATTSGTASYYMVFHTFDNLFKCIWEVNYDTGFMRWCVFRLLLEGRQPDDMYEFIIDLENQNDKRHKLAVKSACPNLDQSIADEEVNNRQFVLMHYDMVKHFCNPRDLIYSVKIVPRIADFALAPVRVHSFE